MESPRNILTSTFIIDHGWMMVGHCCSFSGMKLFMGCVSSGIYCCMFPYHNAFHIRPRPFWASFQSQDVLTWMVVIDVLLPLVGCLLGVDLPLQQQVNDDRWYAKPGPLFFFQKDIIDGSRLLRKMISFCVKIRFPLRNSVRSCSACSSTVGYSRSKHLWNSAHDWLVVWNVSNFAIYWK